MMAVFIIIADGSPNSGHFRAKPYQLMVMQVWERDILICMKILLSTN